MPRGAMWTTMRAMFGRAGKTNTSSSLSDSVVKRMDAVRMKKNAIRCGDATQRERSCFVGEVMSTRIVPRGASHWFEVVISDGTGKINGWFFGRKSIAGLQLGSAVFFEGLVQLDEGEFTIANPYYELL